MAPSPRRKQLEAMLAGSPDDAFLIYGVALEALKEDEAEGLERLRRLTQKYPDYQAAYFQLGQVHSQNGETAEARKWLEQGVQAATRIGDGKAAREMAEFLETIG